MEKIYDVIIIGGGPAGYTAALYTVRAGFSTLLIEKMSAGGQMTQTNEIDNYPGFNEGIDGFTLGMKMQQGAERFGAQTVYEEVVSAKLSEKVKSVSTVKSTYYGKVVSYSDNSDNREIYFESIIYCAKLSARSSIDIFLIPQLPSVIPFFLIYSDISMTT